MAAMLDSKNIATLLLAKRIILAFSGGLDSTVLLHLLNQESAIMAKKLLAVHINHKLSHNADSWQVHCQQVCRDANINFMSRELNLDRASSESLENLARQARYRVLESLVQPGDIVVTGHHQDDQAETLLLQLFRGAGLKGMAAMPMSKPFGKGILYRPLLACSRSALEVYAKQHDLQWIDDESNVDIDFDRNYIRHQVLPVIQQRWPNAVNTISRSAGHHADAQTILDIQAANDVTQLQLSIEQLSITSLKHLSGARQKNALRYWVVRNNFLLPSESVLNEIISQALEAKPDADICIAWDSVEVRRYQDRLYIMSAAVDFNSDAVLPWKNQYTIDGLNLEDLHGKLTIRFRQNNERFHPSTRHKSQSLKKLMQEWKIPTWLRARTPLLYLDDKLIAVIGHAISKEYANV